MTERSIPTGGPPSAITGCTVALERCLALLSEIDDATFVSSAVDGGTVGAHLRHCIEYFRCFLAEERTGVIEYDAREREHALETDRALSERAIASLLEQLSQRHDDDLDRLVKIRQSLAPGAAPEIVKSTVCREWMSLADHTIHHLAIITQLVTAQVNAGTSENHRASRLASELGVAFSTQAHRSRTEISAASDQGPDGCAR